ncbi:hypothetical protein MSAN_00586700 [Mycena sanguinolenta]|uniref:Uncharacterized protein n=1 Tax=Mycena sanguinolenta TaxID=230812 RepID=A0A8H7DHV3_9AGAR|nr:hypothetical protein MSAN_00586700 [Mycena sanguinolenta]
MCVPLLPTLLSSDQIQKQSRFLVGHFQESTLSMSTAPTDSPSSTQTIIVTLILLRYTTYFYLRSQISAIDALEQAYSLYLTINMKTRVDNWLATSSNHTDKELIQFILSYSL